MTIDEYRTLESNAFYHELLQASDRFHVKSNPFRQWSRRWEYPWVVERLRSGKILDAGAGFTFFPFYLAERDPAAEIFCVDYEASLALSYAQISAPRVHFRAGSLQALPFEDETFDSLYCISVLEHTGDYDLVAREFHRVLKPGGQALITFDLCLNGMADISPVGAGVCLRGWVDISRANCRLWRLRMTWSAPNGFGFIFLGLCLGRSLG